MSRLEVFRGSLIEVFGPLVAELQRVVLARNERERPALLTTDVLVAEEPSSLGFTEAELEVVGSVRRRFLAAGEARASSLGLPAEPARTRVLAAGAMMSPYVPAQAAPEVVVTAFERRLRAQCVGMDDALLEAELRFLRGLLRPAPLAVAPVPSLARPTPQMAK